MWTGHGRPSFEEIVASNSNEVVFRKAITVTDDELSLYPKQLLEKHVESEGLKAKLPFYWLGVVYRPAQDGKSAKAVFGGGAIRKFKLRSLDSQDIIVYYREVY